MTTTQAQQPTCINCAHWKSNCDVEGQCRKYALAGPHRWPVTLPDDWCGEFMPRIEIKPLDSTPTDIPSVVARTLWDMVRRDFMAGRAPTMPPESVQHYTMGYNSFFTGETEPGLANPPQPGE